MKQDNTNVQSPDEIELDTIIAKRMLQNVFRACNVTPNAIPLEQIETRANYVRTNFTAYRLVTAFCIFLLLVLPVFFLPVNVDMFAQGQGTSANSLQLTIKSLIPVSKMEATLNGNEVPMQPVSKDEYIINVAENGDLVVAITLITGRSTDYKYKVQSVFNDQSNPVITERSLSGNQLTLTVTDEESGVDFTKINAVDVNGNDVQIISYDEATGILVLPYNHETLNIFIPDKSGNILQAVVSTTKREEN